MAKLSDVANVAGVYNPTTGHYYKPETPMTIQEANAVASNMIARNPAQPSTNRPNFGWSEADLEFYYKTDDESKATNDVANMSRTPVNYAPQPTNNSGLYLCIGVLAVLLFLNR